MIKPDESNSVFDPALKPVFSKTARKTDPPLTNSRDLFYSLIHLSENYPMLPLTYHFLTRQLAHVNQQYGAQFSAKFSNHQLQQLTGCLTEHDQLTQTGVAQKEFFVQFAPVFMTEPSWLSAVVNTATCNSPLAVEIMALYLRLTKAEHSIANSRQVYRGHALAAGVALPDIYTQAFAQHTEIKEEIFELAALQLGLGQFPRALFPEILGFTLSYCQSLSLPEKFFDREKVNNSLAVFFGTRETRRREEVSTVTGLIQSYLSGYPELIDELWRRIQSGFWLHQSQTASCTQSIRNSLQTELSPRQAMHKLLQELAPRAIGHHGRIRIGAKTIDEWFKEQPFKSENFLASILHTPYVDRHKPENSKLLKLFEFNGPMFGVLDELMQTTVKTWLLTELNPELLERQKDIQSTIRARNQKYGLQKISHEPVKPTGLFEPPPETSNSSPTINYGSLNQRELYFYLVNHDIYPEILPAAKNKAARWLTWTQWLTKLPVKIYSHRNFEQFIHKIFQREADAYKPLIGAPKLSKAVFTWGIEQFAPAILADGCWLQGACQLDYSPHAGIGELLQKIYADEAGNGIYQQNHPHIYRQLLDSLAIKLPPIHSQEFSKHPGFVDGAFDIPVFLIALSKFPATFLPELLGVNMAIELSGLGKVYPRLSEELKYYGINPAIVDIHTSIDNLATGHSALAIKAIQVYLDDVLTAQGEISRQQHWRRIYTGFCALKFVGRRFRLALMKQYLSRQKAA